MSNPLISTMQPNHQGFLNNTILPSKKEEKTGFCPYVLDGFSTCEAQNQEARSRFSDKKIKATVLTAVNPDTVNKLDLAKIVKMGALVCLVFKQGVVEKMTVHPKWYDKIIEMNALELVYKTKINGELSMYPNKFALVKMTESSYENMVKNFKLEQFL